MCTATVRVYVYGAYEYTSHQYCVESTSLHITSILCRVYVFILSMCVCLYIGFLYDAYSLSALKLFWNPAGVEPSNQEGPSC